MAVDVRLQGTGHPFHGDFPFPFDFAELGIPEREGRVFLKTSEIRTVVAFHRHNDQLRGSAVHVLFHAPAFSVSGMGIEKDVMSVKHIQDRIPSFRLRLIGFRQIDICISFLLVCERRNCNFPGIDHNKPSFLFMM